MQLSLQQPCHMALVLNAALLLSLLLMYSNQKIQMIAMVRRNRALQ